MLIALACLVLYGLVGWAVSEAFAYARSESASEFEAEGDFVSADFVLDVAPWIDGALWPLALATYLTDRGR